VVSADQKTNDESRCVRWPSQPEEWPCSEGAVVGPECNQDNFSQASVQSYARSKTWTWTGRHVFFVSDIHADTDAFFVSLAGGGGIKKTGPEDADFELTDLGRSSRFIIGGDCFDKGPSNLRLLEAIHQLYLKGADIVLLAGNHDVRTYLGIYHAQSKDPLLDHLFVRMGKKTVPLLKEIFDKFIGDDHVPSTLDAVKIRAKLYPDESWYDNFPTVASGWVRPEKLKKELLRVREKVADFDARVQEFDMGMEEIFAATEKFRELFFSPSGRYFWFFDKMKLAHREGSYIYLHAGLDDETSRIIRKRGVEALNQQFKDGLMSAPFDLYHGIIGNTFRTKYRTQDYDFTSAGVEHLHCAGIYAIVHGHRNLRRGQRVLIRAGMLNFECDASVDSHTRAKEGLDGPGGAIMIFSSEGTVCGLSTDYPYIKTFHPGTVTIDKQAASPCADTSG